MDEREGLPSYPDNFFDLAIVDPPYGIKQDGRNNHTRSSLTKSKNYTTNTKYDNHSPDKKYFKELIRVSKNQIIWGANHFISKIPFDSSCWIVWDKDNGLNHFADCELAYTSFPSAVRKVTFKWQGMLQQDMKNKEFRIHPNQKPVKLYQWIVSEYCKIGDLILDTHVGSASSLIAFESMGFNYHAFEIDEDYYKAALERMRAGIQTAIF